MRLTLFTLPVKDFLGVKVFMGMAPSSSSRGTLEREILVSVARATTERPWWAGAERLAKACVGAMACTASRCDNVLSSPGQANVCPNAASKQVPLEVFGWHPGQRDQ